VKEYTLVNRGRVDQHVDYLGPTHEAKPAQVASSRRDHKRMEKAIRRHLMLKYIDLKEKGKRIFE
jgi:hypothetical protein